VQAIAILKAVEKYKFVSNQSLVYIITHII